MLFSLLFCTQALAESWIKISESKGSDEYFYDQDSISRTGSLVSFTLVINYQNPNSDIYSDRSDTVIDCMKDQSKTLNLISYSQHNLKGDILYKARYPNAVWIHAPANTVLYGIEHKVCELNLSNPIKVQT
jgi:hypothetical protein